MEQTDLEELYQTVILDHSTRPRNFGPLPDATITVDGDNPTCGDEVHLHVRVGADGGVEKVSFTGSGCSICMASASMMTAKVKGKSHAEAASLLHDFQAMISAEPQPQPAKSLGELRLLSGVRKFPQRVKCATLAWHALRGALETNPVAAGSEDGLDLREPRKVSTEEDGDGLSLG